VERPGERLPPAASRFLFDLPDALWQNRREMGGAFIRAVTRGRAVTRREEPGPRGAMTGNGLYVAYARRCNGMDLLAEHEVK